QYQTILISETDKHQSLKRVNAERLLCRPERDGDTGTMKFQDGSVIDGKGDRLKGLFVVCRCGCSGDISRDTRKFYG
ncbi:hypothetical protein DE83_23435, partial [Salmonella enterica subsp. enterica serovar Kentucky]|uniref:hypothetical protein n=2 Tax=Salmonella enterica TaxID=28901 RepID=UPI0006A54D98